jgi:hypothetical protein
MAAELTENGLDSLITEILSSSARGSKKPAFQRIQRDFQSSAQTDYSAKITALFDINEMREIMAEFKKAIPAANAQVLRMREPERLAQVATQLGARFLMNHFEGESGRALRGFYVNDVSVTKRPLICLNGASHPSAVAAAFWHEVGHHLTSRAFGISHPLNLSFSETYEEHLNDPVEIAADVLTAVGGYPYQVAKRLFARFEQSGKAPDIDDLVSMGREYLRTKLNIDFRRISSTTESLHYVAGMMHFARLRWVLFSEYGI